MKQRISALCGLVYCCDCFGRAKPGVFSRFAYRWYTTSAIMSAPAGVKRNADHLPSSAAGDDSKKAKSNGSITSFFGAPKAKPAEAKPPAAVANFDKQKWADSLTAEQRELLQLEIDTMDESWLARLKEDLVTPDFLALKQFLKKEKETGAKVFPPEKDIYSCYGYGSTDILSV